LKFSIQRNVVPWVLRWKGLFRGSPRVAGLEHILAAYHAAVLLARISNESFGDFIGEHSIGIDILETGSVAKSIDVLSDEGPLGWVRG